MFTYLIVIIAVALASMIISMGYNIFTNSLNNELTVESLFPGGTMIIVKAVLNLSCLAAALVEMKIQGYKFRDISPVKQNWKMYLLTVVFAPAVFFVLRFVNSIFLQITGIPSSEGTEQMSEVALATAFVEMLIYPFAEELIFRGLTFKNFEKNNFPVLFSAAVTTIAFALFRDKRIMLYALLLGAVLIFIRCKFGDIKLCILLHLTANLTYCLTRLADISIYSTMMKTGCAVGVIIAAVTMFLMLKSASKPADTGNIS